MALIETQDLTKIYNDKIALSNVGLRIEQGDFFAIVGPSGAGKTTLLRLLDLLEEPSSGCILFNDIDTSIPDKDRMTLRRQIGMVFQRSVMFNTSVYDNVAYPLRIRGIKNDIDRRVNEVLELVGLEGFERRHALTLSGGEAQRVSLAQAMVFQPRLLLLDEPTANLDPRNVSIIESIITKINHQEQVTIVMATHNIGQAEQIASKVAILREGVLAEVGNATEVLRRPSELLVSFARVNAYSGEANPNEDGLASVDIGDNVQIEAATRKKGKVTVFIRPEDIILSASPIKSSARNTLKGKVTGIIDLAERVQLNVDAGKEFKVIITKKSFQDLKLNLDAEVYLSFKASSVRVL
jgi:tungstate transport system ATP-binding protein